MKPFEIEDTYAYCNFNDFIEGKRELSQCMVLYLDEQLVDDTCLQNTLNLHIKSLQNTINEDIKNDNNFFSAKFLDSVTIIFLVYKDDVNNKLAEQIYSLVKDKTFIFTISLIEDGLTKSLTQNFKTTINVTQTQFHENKLSITNIINAIWNSMFYYTLSENYEDYDKENEIVAEFADIVALLGDSGTVSYHLIESKISLLEIVQGIPNIISKISSNCSNYVCIIFEHNNVELLENLLYISDNIIEPFYNVVDDGNGVMYYTYPNKKLLSGCIKVHFFINELD